MTTIVADCFWKPASDMTFDVIWIEPTKKHGRTHGIHHLMATCRCCHQPMLFLAQTHEVVQQPALTSSIKSKPRFEVISSKTSEALALVGIQDRLKMIVPDQQPARDQTAPPEHLPDDIERAFREAAKCLSNECWNAAGCMFRLCIDLATKPLAQQHNVKGMLGQRLPKLFELKALNPALKPLSTCIKDYGNDGAHDGNLQESDAYDIKDFTVSLLEHTYTIDVRLKNAISRRGKNRGQ